MARVLLVDDDELLRDLLALRLEVEGHEIITADDGAAALATLRGMRCDLVVLDIMMPVMDGLRFLRTLRAEIADPPPVVVLSAAGHGALERELLAAGARGVVRKPVDPSELARHVAAAVGTAG